MFSMIYKDLGTVQPLRVISCPSASPGLVRACCLESDFLRPEAPHFLDGRVLTFLNFIWANNLSRAN